MPISLPYIPESITVHLGAPDSPAANVTVSFIEYVKNVVSSEIYPTWEPAALSANTFAIVSYALNRVYTEFYRSRGYSFDITSSTAIDQKFIQGRNIFENISVLVDEMFNDYIRRPGFLEPLAAKFCNGTTATCNGLSQWGSQELAQSGRRTLSILQFYFGNNIEIVYNAAVQGVRESYPGTPLSLGDSGPYVRFLQTELNRISQNYPAIPKVTVDGIFGEGTLNAVRTFQPIFSLTDDGIVGRATWYRIVQVYVAVLRLSELQSEGRTYTGVSWEYPDAIVLGDTGIKVSHLQFMLSVLSEFIEQVPPVEISGSFDEATFAAVEGFQRYAGLSINGVVDAQTWDEIYSQFAGIEATVFDDVELFPFTEGATPAQSISELQNQLRRTSGTDSEVPPPGSSGCLDRQTRRAVECFQRRQGLGVTGNPDDETLTELAENLNSDRYQYSSRFSQCSRKNLSVGMRDAEVE